MPYFTTEMDISVNDFLSECNSYEIKEIIDALIEDNHLNESSLIEDINISSNDLDWLNVLTKLKDLRIQLTKDEEEFVRNLVKKYHY